MTWLVHWFWLWEFVIMPDLVTGRSTGRQWLRTSFHPLTWKEAQMQWRRKLYGSYAIIILVGQEKPIKIFSWTYHFDTHKIFLVLFLKTSWSWLMTLLREFLFLGIIFWPFFAQLYNFLREIPWKSAFVIFLGRPLDVLILFVSVSVVRTSFWTKYNWTPT